MSSTAACTNCRTTYSLLNREVGCSSCALSFCKRCLGYRASLPKLANTPVPVCFECFQKIGTIVTDNVQITTTPLPQTSSHNKKYPVTDKKWWGDNPPPSMRNNVGYMKSNDAVSTNGQSVERVLTLEEIEERLAALRGCDIEVVRNPRLWFHSTNNVAVDSAAGLLKMVEDQIAIEEDNDPVKYLEERYKQLHKDDEENQNVGGCFTHLTTYGARDPGFNNLTEEEIICVNRLMEEASHRVKLAEIDEKRIKSDLEQVLDASAKISLNIPKVSDEDGTLDNKEIKHKISISEQEITGDSEVQDAVSEAELPGEYSYALSDSDFTDNMLPKRRSFFRRIFKR